MVYVVYKLNIAPPPPGLSLKQPSGSYQFTHTADDRNKCTMRERERHTDKHALLPLTNIMAS